MKLYAEEFVQEEFRKAKAVFSTEFPKLKQRLKVAKAKAELREEAATHGCYGFSVSTLVH